MLDGLAGLELGYRETGEPDAVPVLLLHATGGRADTWDRFAAALADAGRYVIALDLRGHGTSAHPGEYSLELMVDDVVGFLDARGLARVDLVGHSLGGFVAMSLAARDPARVRRMILEDAPPPLRDNGFSDGRPLPPEEPPEPVDFDWRLVRPIFRALRTPDPWFWTRVPAVTARTLLISGGHTSLVDPGRIDELAASLPDAHVVTIDVGHLIHDTAPAEFAGAVIAFLAER